jgi:hypothetical protein
MDWIGLNWIVITFYTEPRAGCEFGDVDDFDGELLLCFSVQTSSHQAERTSVTQTNIKTINSLFYTEYAKFIKNTTKP